MEKLQQALEKARRERAEAVTNRWSGGPRGPSEPVEARPPASGDVEGAFERRRETPIVSVAPQLLKRNRLVAADDGDRRADVFRVLRTRVMQRLESTGKNVVAIASAGPAEGKTLIAVNLAISLARQIDCTVLLVDLDLRRPGVHRHFGLSEGTGLADYLRGRGSLEDCLVNPGIPRLTLLPQYEAIHDSSELLAAPRMVQLAAEMKKRYPGRIILYDLPPLLFTDDALVGLQYADTLLLVVQEGKTKRKDLDKALDLLHDIEIIGTVLNDSRYEGAGYYHEHAR